MHTFFSIIIMTKVRISAFPEIVYIVKFGSKFNICGLDHSGSETFI